MDKWKPVALTALPTARAGSLPDTEPAAPISAPKRQRGVVVEFDHIKGYGFIRANGQKGGRKIFVHQRAIDMPGYRTLFKGQRVEFDLDSTDTRGPRAVNVSQPGGRPFPYGHRPSESGPGDEYWPEPGEDDDFDDAAYYEMMAVLDEY